MAITAFPYTAVLDVSANSLLGNNTGSTAAAIALTATQVRSLLSVYTSAQVDSLLAGYQPLDSDLTAIAALTTTSFGRSLLTQADAAATLTTIGAAATIHTHAAADITSGVIATARLASSGTADATTYLRGDQTWATVSAGVTGSTGSVDNAMLRADGTGGSTVQGSLVSIDDAGQIQFRGTYSRFNVQLRNPAYGSSHGILLDSAGIGFVSNGAVPNWVFAQTDSNLSGTATATIVWGGDLTLRRQSANRLAQRNGTNAQGWELYNTYTSDTSYERLEASWALNVCTIEVTKGSAGGTLQGLRFGGASTSLLGFYGATPVDRPDTVADPAGGGTIDAEARTAINAIIDRLQELGLIA